MPPHLTVKQLWMTYNIIKAKYSTMRTLATLKAFAIKIKTLKINNKKLDKRGHICKRGGDGIFS